MLTGSLPFEGNTVPKLIKNIDWKINYLTNDLNVSYESKDLIKKLITKKP